jgi:putative sterol carrier protein
MSSATDQFFQQLGRRGHEPLLVKANGTLRFDLKDDRKTSHWLVEMRKGDIKVSRENRDADGVVVATRAILDEIVTGNVNALAALLRGVLVYQGDPALLVWFQRLFPGPPDARERGRAAGYARRQS